MNPEPEMTLDQVPLNSNRAFKGAWLKGYRAGLKDASAKCPYPDLRGGRYLHIVTWSRAFQTAWREGFQAAMKKRAHASGFSYTLLIRFAEEIRKLKEKP